MQPVSWLPFAHSNDRETNSHALAAPYSSSTTNTVSGLSSASFMNTYGKHNSLATSFSQALTNHTSLPIHNNGRPNANLHDLRHPHKRRLHTYLPHAADRLPPLVLSLLDTRRGKYRRR